MQQTKKQDVNQKGYSLAELAVVIAIIGLLVAAVSAAVNLRASSELQGIIFEVNKYKGLVQSFDAKYDDLPGDMVDAHDYWDDGSDGVCGTEAECNGNGDGDIRIYQEAYRFWQHLVLAGFIDGGYTGVGGSSGVQADIGINVPPSPRSQVGYFIYHLSFIVLFEDNYIYVGGFSENQINAAAALTPSEALLIDKKMDDGLPLVGGVKGHSFGLGGEGDCLLSSEYNIANEGVACVSAILLE